MQIPSFYPYPTMVNSLFKRGPYASQHVDLVHVAMGILGEAIELENGEAEENEDNVREECGDLEFYLEAAYQLLSDGNRAFAMHFAGALDRELLSLYQMPLVELAEQFHDRIKKIWVYAQPLETHILHLAVLIGALRGRLEVRYDLMDTTREAILLENQEKLALRYPEGVYTDKAAAERADKAESVALEADPATTEGADND